MSSRSTLLRYARVQRPRVYDLTSRAAADPELTAILDEPREAQLDWANRFLESWKGVPEETSAAEYRSILRETAPVDRFLPDRRDLRPDRVRELAEIPASSTYRNDLSRLLKATVAMRLTGRDAEAEETAHLHQLLERLPDLPDRSGREPYAPAVLRRFEPRERNGSHVAPIAIGDASDAKATDDQEHDSDTRGQLLEDLSLLWRLRNRALREARAAATARENAFEPAALRVPIAPAAAAKRRPATKRSAPPDESVRAEREAKKEAARTRFRALRQHSAERAARLEALRHQEADASVVSMLKADPNALAALSGGMSLDDITDAQRRLYETPMLKPYEKMGFCQAYESIKSGMDTTPIKKAPKSLAANCFAETPTFDFGDSVELLGTAELIKIEEHLIGYSEAEISYVENILAGERRYREVKALNEFEQTDVEASQQVSVTTQEKRATTTQTLASEVAQAVSTRFDTDVSASASGSAGGTIGVVSLQGEGALDMGVGIGVDTSLSSNTRSEFGTEIIDAATEAVTRASQVSRTTRARSLFRTLDQHEIDNSGDNPQHRRGIYCFLNKHVCVTETPYGSRWFLKAVISLPGRTLVCDRVTRLAMALADLDQPPDFDITPADIHPSNYRELAGKYKAQGINPPPAAVRHIGRTYKSDQTNQTSEQAQGLEKFGLSAMPLFKAYKRHLIADTIAIPDGYMVQEVRLAISHGANGLSIPVDLPAKLAGTGIMALPTLFSVYPFFFLMPVAVWQLLQLLSPVLHHNTDSSSVSATIGTEAQESNYYFFEADFLLAEILSLFGSFSAMGEEIMEQIQEMVANLPEQLNDSAADLTSSIQDALDAIVSSVQAAFDAISTALQGVDLTNPDISGLIDSMVTALTDFGTAIATTMGSIPSDLFAPLSTFLQSVVALISEAAQSAMSDLMAALLAGAENNQQRAYAESFGATGELPVSFNIVSIKPGVSINLVACLARTDEALDAWRLDVFARLYQAYLQLVAEYESKRFLGTAAASKKSPGTMRQEERQAIRNLVIHALNGVWPTGLPQNEYSFERANLFEHAIDWENVSYRLYNYGPDLREIFYDQRGVFNGADEQRRAFLTAAWSQIMLPLSADPVLERAMLAYFESGSISIGADLTNDELAALWADVISRRTLYADVPEPVSSREIVLPTDLLVLRTDDSLPENLPTPCSG